MDYISIIFAVALCLIFSVAVIICLPSVAKFGVFIILAASLATVAGLQHTTGRIVTYNSFTQNAAILSPGTVNKACGEKTVNNTLCYKEVEYRGYPINMIAIEYPPNSEKIITLTRGAKPGGLGLITNYVIYFALFTLLALLIKKISLSKASKNLR